MPERYYHHTLSVGTLGHMADRPITQRILRHTSIKLGMDAHTARWFVFWMAIVTLH